MAFAESVGVLSKFLSLSLDCQITKRLRKTLDITPLAWPDDMIWISQGFIKLMVGEKINNFLNIRFDERERTE